MGYTLHLEIAAPVPGFSAEDMKITKLAERKSERQKPSRNSGWPQL